MPDVYQFGCTVSDGVNSKQWPLFVVEDYFQKTGVVS